MHFHKPRSIDKTKYTLSLNQNEKINFFPAVNNQEKIIIIYVPFQSSIEITYEDPLRLEITNLYIKGSSTIFFQSPSLCIKKGSKNNTLEAPTDLSGKRIVIEGFYASITVIDFLTPLFICSFYQGCIYSIHSASNTAEVMLYFASDEQMFRFDSMPLEIRQIALVTCSYIIMNLKKKRDEFLERMSIPNTPRKGVINIPKTQLTLRLAKSKGSSFDFSYDIANKQIVIKNNHNKSEPKLPLIDVNAAKTIKITDGTKKGSGNPGVSLQYCIFEVIK